MCPLLPCPRLPPPPACLPACLLGQNCTAKLPSPPRDGLGSSCGAGGSSVCTTHPRLPFCPCVAPPWHPGDPLFQTRPHKHTWLALPTCRNALDLPRIPTLPFRPPSQRAERHLRCSHSRRAPAPVAAAITAQPSSRQDRMRRSKTKSCPLSPPASTGAAQQFTETRP